MSARRSNRVRAHHRRTKFAAAGVSMRYSAHLLAAILLIGIALSIFMYAGPQPLYDDSFYIFLAHMAATGNTGFLGSEFAFGFMNILPESLSFMALGYGSVQAVLPDMIEYALLVLFTFLTARLIGGDLMGIVASFLAATAPFAVSIATRPLPDLSIGMAVAFALYMIFKSARSRNAIAMPFAAGAACAFTVYMKPTGYAFIAPTMLFMLAALVYDASKGRRGGVPQHPFPRVGYRYLALFLAGFAVAMAAYFSVFYLEFTAPFFPLVNYVNSQGPPLALKAGVFNPDPFSVYGTYPEIYTASPLIFMALAGAILSAWKRDRCLMYLSAVAWFVVLYFFLGTGTFGRYVPVPFSTRYLDAILSPLAIIAAAPVLSLRSAVGCRLGARAGTVCVLAVAVAVLALDAPVYASLYASNIGIPSVESAFQSIMGTIYSNAGTHNVDVYAQSNTQYALQLFQSLQFAADYNPGTQFYIANWTIIPYNNAVSCVGPNRPSYLVTLYPKSLPQGLSSPGNPVSSWLGQNCSGSMIYSGQINYTGSKVQIISLHSR